MFVLTKELWTFLSQDNLELGGNNLAKMDIEEKKSDQNKFFIKLIFVGLKKVEWLRLLHAISY